jgi:hypothetical protein
MTYRDDFPIGSRVRVRAGASEGTDHEFNGATGTIVDFKGYLAVEIDQLPRYWKNPVLISPHNLCRTVGERAQRREALDELTAHDQALGLYDGEYGRGPGMDAVEEQKKKNTERNS